MNDLESHSPHSSIFDRSAHYAMDVDSMSLQNNRNRLRMCRHRNPGNINRDRERSLSFFPTSPNSSDEPPSANVNNNPNSPSAMPTRAPPANSIFNIPYMPPPTLNHGNSHRSSRLP